MDILSQALKGSAQDHGTTKPTSSQHLTHTSSKPSLNQGNVIPQFINVTDSVSLDKSARTQVRVQVMRDYHRRRIQGEKRKETGLRPEKREKEKPTPSAKSQTHKFRLGHEQVLRTWVPVKTPTAKRVDGAGGISADQVKRRAPSKAKTQQSKIPSDGRVPNELGDGAQPMPMSLDESTETQEHPALPEPIDRWLSLFDVALKSPALPKALGSGSLDPFSTTALLVTPRTELLLHHYFNVRLQSAWLMMPMRKNLFSRAIHDTAMFHSFLSHYAATYNIGFKTGDSSESTFHIAMSAKLVNQRLADPSHALTDDTIATVANLAAYESSNGSAASMVVHMDGLERMVQMRGGIFEGGFSPIVQRMIGWTDFHVATALLRKPRFPPLRFADTEEPIATSPSPSLLPFLSQPEALASATILPTSKLQTLLIGVNSLSNTLKALRRRPCMPQENIWYSDKIYHIQRSLFDIAHCTKEECVNVNGSLDALCALAALIYCGRYLRDVPLSFVVTAHAVTRLNAAIEKHEETYVSAWDWDLDVDEGAESKRRMFWILGFGGIAAEGKSEHAWFVERFGAQGREMGIRSWEEARRCLGEVLWQEELDEAGARLSEEAFADEDEMSAWVE